MITIEQAHSCAAEVANRAGMPSDMTLGLWIGRAKTQEGESLEIIRLTIEIEDPEGGEHLRVKMTMENRENLQLETFEVWLLGFIQGAMGVLDAAELAAAAEMGSLFESTSERVH